MQETAIIGRHHAQLEMLFSIAPRAVSAEPERVNLSAVRTAANLRRPIFDFEVRVGMVEPRERINFHGMSEDRLEAIHEARLRRDYSDLPGDVENIFPGHARKVDGTGC